MDKELRRTSSLWRSDDTREGQSNQWRLLHLLACGSLGVVIILNWAQVASSVSMWQLLGGTPFRRGLPHARAHIRPAIFKGGPGVDFRAAARVLQPDLMAGAPEAFSSEYKNPCWEAAGDLHCLPYFYFLGGFQAGGKDLQAKMLRHPQIAKPANSQPHFWAEKQDMGKYVRSYDAAVQEIKGNPAKHVVGDFSPSTLAGYWAMQVRLHPETPRVKGECSTRCKQLAKDGTPCAYDACYAEAHSAEVATAERAGLTYEQMQTQLLMRAVYGARPPKFIVALRSPRERLHSAFWTYGHYWGRYGGKSAEGFHAYALDQMEGFRNCTAGGTARGTAGGTGGAGGTAGVDAPRDVFHCALYFESLSQALEDVFFHCDQLMRGMYTVWLHLWFSFFSRDQFLIFRSEDYFADPRAVLTLAFAHLDLSEPTAAEWEHILAGSKIEAGATGQEMLPAARSAVDAFYAPFNEDLAELLGDPKWLWAE